MVIAVKLLETQISLNICSVLYGLLGKIMALEEKLLQACMRLNTQLFIDYRMKVMYYQDLQSSVGYFSMFFMF